MTERLLVAEVGTSPESFPFSPSRWLEDFLKTSRVSLWAYVEGAVKQPAATMLEEVLICLQATYASDTQAAQAGMPDAYDAKELETLRQEVKRAIKWYNEFIHSENIPEELQKTLVDALQAPLPFSLEGTTRERESTKTSAVIFLLLVVNHFKLKQEARFAGATDRLTEPELAKILWLHRLAVKNYKLPPVGPNASDTRWQIAHFLLPVADSFISELGEIWFMERYPKSYQSIEKQIQAQFGNFDSRYMGQLLLWIKHAVALFLHPQNLQGWNIIAWITRKPYFSIFQRIVLDMCEKQGQGCNEGSLTDENISNHIKSQGLGVADVFRGRILFDLSHQTNQTAIEGILISALGRWFLPAPDLRRIIQNVYPIYPGDLEIRAYTTDQNGQKMHPLFDSKAQETTKLNTQKNLFTEAIKEIRKAVTSLYNGSVRSLMMFLRLNVFVPRPGLRGNVAEGVIDMEVFREPFRKKAWRIILTGLGLRLFATWGWLIRVPVELQFVLASAFPNNTHGLAFYHTKRLNEVLSRLGVEESTHNLSP